MGSVTRFVVGEVFSFGRSTFIAFGSLFCNNTISPLPSLEVD
jgi:hypothetical protein